MLFNYKTINAFCDYNSLENFYLRGTPFNFEFLLTENSESIAVTRSFTRDNYFDFIRFFNLVNFIFGYRKPCVSFKSSSFFTFTRIFSAKFLYFFLRNLNKFQRSPKGSFIKIVFFDNGVGSLRIREPHVAFSVLSPYFDYHSSKLNLNLEFLYKSKPQFLYKLVWLFGI